MRFFVCVILGVLCWRAQSSVEQLLNAGIGGGIGRVKAWWGGGGYARYPLSSILDGIIALDARFSENKESAPGSTALRGVLTVTYKPFLIVVQKELHGFSTSCKNLQRPLRAVE